MNRATGYLKAHELILNVNFSEIEVKHWRTKSSEKFLPQKVEKWQSYGLLWNLTLLSLITLPKVGEVKILDPRLDPLYVKSHQKKFTSKG